MHVDVCLGQERCTWPRMRRPGGGGDRSTPLDANMMPQALHSVRAPAGPRRMSGVSVSSTPQLAHRTSHPPSACRVWGEECGIRTDGRMAVVLAWASVGWSAGRRKVQQGGVRCRKAAAGCCAACSGWKSHLRPLAQQLALLLLLEAGQACLCNHAYAVHISQHSHMGSQQPRRVRHWHAHDVAPSTDNTRGHLTVLL
jgi:hypothetical protein